MEDTQSNAMLVKSVRADGRRVYEWEAKLAIVPEAMMPGVSLAKVALCNGLNANLLRKWVVKHRAQAVATSGARTAMLLPVMVVTSSEVVVRTKRSQAVPRERMSIEVECARGVARFDDGIDRAVLRDLIEALSLR